MSRINIKLFERLKSLDSSKKMNQLAKLSTSGELSSFSGIFQLSPLSKTEEDALKALLESHKGDLPSTEEDFHTLRMLTSEIKAIHNQAVILHGERIKKAQTILKKYRDGAFTAYLMAAYGNRQTPYNFLLYYEFYKSLPEPLQQKIHEMPKQVVYSLSSRTGSQQEKEEFIQNYQGETKVELLSKLRAIFPLEAHDKRKHNLSDTVIKTLIQLISSLERGKFTPSAKESKEIDRLLNKLKELTRTAQH